ncbi:unnamed protein product, partial [Musa acuminata subsp. burmannicoides]
MELVDAGASYWCCLRDRLHGFGPFPEPQGHTLTTDSFSMRTEIYDNKMLSFTLQPKEHMIAKNSSYKFARIWNKAVDGTSG